MISGRTEKNIDETIRLLKIAWAQPDHREHRVTLVNSADHLLSQYAFFPVFDSQAMSMYLRDSSWYRMGPVTQKVQKGDTIFFHEHRHL